MNAKLWNRVAAAVVFGAFVAVSTAGAEGCKPKAKKAIGAD
jgi:hypothetical protein